MYCTHIWHIWQMVYCTVLLYNEPVNNWVPDYFQTNDVITHTMHKHEPPILDLPLELVHDW